MIESFGYHSSANNADGLLTCNNTLKKATPVNNPNNRLI